MSADGPLLPEIFKEKVDLGHGHADVGFGPGDEPPPEDAPNEAPPQEEE